jgi:hypothetical protein
MQQKMEILSQIMSRRRATGKFGGYARKDMNGLQLLPVG